MGECDWAYDCSPLHTACVTLIRREHKAIIIMASSLRRRGVLARHQEDLLRSKKLGAIYIRPDTTPNPYIHQSIFTPRHVSFNTSSSLLMTQMVDKEYQVEKNSRLSKEERQILGIQNKYSVRPRTAELYKDADRRRRELKRRQRQPPPGHQSKPTIYAGRRPQSAPNGQSCYDRLYNNTAYLRPAKTWSRDDDKAYIRNLLTKKVRNKHFVPRVGRLCLGKHARPSDTNLKFHDIECRTSTLPEKLFSVHGRTMLPRYFINRY